MKSRFSLVSLSVLTACVPFAVNGAQTPPPSRAIIVLDASGSMWGKVKDKPKIEIAREVIREFVSDLPENTELGLIAYGHRRKGDCEDIELLIPPGAVSKEKFVSTVNGLQPKGMTPLTAAVEFAAEELKYEEQRASVILVTDGEETCDRDPCEVATKLEAAGLDFTAHVIAFDLADKAAQSVKCLATTTGGEFLRANDAKTLKQALDTAMVATVAPKDVSLRAPKHAPTRSEITVKWSSSAQLKGHLTFVPQNSLETSTTQKFEFTEGDTQRILTPEKPGTYEIHMVDEATKEVIAKSLIEIYLNDIQLDAPDKAVLGSEVPITWSGTEGKDDFISIVPKSWSDDESPKNWRFTKEGSPLKVRAPSSEGKAEIRYHHRASGQIFARKDIEIIEANITLKTPASAVSGSMVNVEWTGPNNSGDFITIVPKGFNDDNVGRYAYTRAGSPLKIESPLHVGDTEIRYYDGAEKRILARAEMQLLEFTVSLDAPKTAQSGSLVKIKFEGPDNPNDFITIVPRNWDEDRHGKYAYTKGVNEVKVLAPEMSGTAEIRYIAGQNKEILARQLIELSENEVIMEAPKSSPSGSLVKVQFKAPNNPNDFITIVPKEFPDEKHAKYEYVRDKDTVQVISPLIVGEAEIRYVSGQSQKVLARQIIELKPTEIVLNSPESAPSGSTVHIPFEALNNPNDYITIVPEDFPDDKHGKYAYTRDATSVKVIAPLMEGVAEVRYINGQEGRVLARKKLQLTAVTVELNSPEEAVSGSRVNIPYIGPNHENDYITIVPADYADDKHANYEYVRGDKEAANVIAPLIEGAAEVRYVNGQTGKILARKPIQLKAIEVILQSPEEAVSGSRVKIPYEGPRNPNDYITIVPVNYPDDKYNKYDYCKPEQEAVNVIAPVMEGEAEVRYVSGQGNKVLARKKIQLKGFKISFDAPASAAAGSRFKVAYEGPANPNDYVTIVPINFPDEKYAKFDYARPDASEVNLQMPETTGASEIRYVCGQTGKVLHRQAIDCTTAQ